MDQQLLNRIRQCENLPTLPAVAVQVLELVRDPKTEVAQLARLVSKDPALASKILRTVNSSIYVRPKKVSKLTQALALLGLQTVRVLVLGFSLVRNLKNYKNKGFRPLEYWRRAIYSATAALTLAQRMHLELQEEAFVAALLMDLGMLVLDDLFGEQYGRINEKARTHGELVKLEEALLQTTHAQVSGALAEMWGLPQVLSAPMAWHHKPAGLEDPSLRQLAQVCYLAGRCADIFVEESAAMAITELREYCAAQYSMTERDCDVLLNQIARRTGEIAPLFDINLNASVSYETILKKANDSMIQLTLASQVESRRERHKIQEQASIDPLTRLANRRRFEGALADAFATVDPVANPLALVMIRIDRFETLKEQKGGPAGDAVVQLVAHTMQSPARPHDLAARFNEDTMALLLPGLGRAEALGLAEAIRREIFAAVVDVGRDTLPVTVSAGVAAVEAETPFKEPDHLLRATTLALDAAANAGHNCVRAFSRGKPPTGHSAAA